MSYLGILGEELFKKLSHIWNQHPAICQVAKFCEKKLSNLGAKNDLWLKKVFVIEFQKKYCHIWNEHLQICLISKFCKKKQKCVNYEPKTPYLGIFELKI